MVGDLRQRICQHIMENASSKNISVDCINGSSDHLHALIYLGSDQTIAKIAQLLKGESSHWVNKENLSQMKFEWQDDYYAESVSWARVRSLTEYIANQEEHHRKRTFAEELDGFLKEHSLSKNEQTGTV
jgi:putative transposase